jgi:hypothetical protein
VTALADPGTDSGLHISSRCFMEVSCIRPQVDHNMGMKLVKVSGPCLRNTSPSASATNINQNSVMNVIFMILNQLIRLLYNVAFGDSSTTYGIHITC